MNYGVVGKFFKILKKFLKRKTSKKKYPIFFIIGNPCSGTTLTHQFLAKTGTFFYISNFISKFYMIPILGAEINKLFKITNHKKITYKSENGRTNELSNVHEFGYFWERFFKHEHKIQNFNLKKYNLAKAGLILHNLANLNKSPVVIKNNTFISMNLKIISENISDAYFIHCQRDNFQVAQSIFKARIRQNLSKDKWWSMKPLGYEEIKDLDVYDQIAFQVNKIEEEIKKEINSIDKKKIIKLRYEDFCNCTNKLIKEVNKVLDTYNINKIEETSIKFKSQNGIRLNKKDYYNLKKSISKQTNNF